MRDMLFSMPVGPMPGERVDVKPPLGPVPPQFKWTPSADNPNVEVNGLGQMRTCLPTPAYTPEDEKMVRDDQPMFEVTGAGAAMVGFRPDAGSYFRSLWLSGEFGGNLRDSIAQQRQQIAAAETPPAECQCASCHLQRQLKYGRR